MRQYKEGKLKTGKYGALFPQRPYYPLLASNGTDAILLGLGGFPDDPNWMCYSAQLPFRVNLGWYKTARKDYAYAHRHYGSSPYGTSVCLAGLTTMLTVGRERNLGIREPKQYFDPKKRVLTTFFSLRESRGGKTASIKVTSFMTNEHLLVEHYEVLRAAESEIRFGFCLDTPRSTDLYELCVYPEKIVPGKIDGGICFSYKYNSPEIYDGMAATWTDSRDSEYFSGADHPTVYSPVVSKGGSITRFTAVVDSYDAKNYRAEVNRLRKKTLTIGYEGILKEHLKAGEAYCGASSVNLPDKDLEYLYDYSNYILGCTYDSASGFMPMGILPGNWHNAMFWDCWFASMAWLGCNRAAMSEKTSRFYMNKLEEARQVAKKLKCGGARFAWTTNRAHFELNPESVIQFHNNAVIAVQCLQVFNFTGDIKFLEDIIGLVEESLVFLTERLVRIENGRAVLSECAGLDESTADKKGTDTWTAAVYAKALDMYLDACAKLQRKPFNIMLQQKNTATECRGYNKPNTVAAALCCRAPLQIKANNLAEISAMVKEAMNRNIDKSGVLQSFAGGMKPHWGSLIFHLYPEHPALKRTIDKLSHYDSELDSYNSHEVACYRGRIFTWTEYWISAIMGMKGKSEGWTRLRKCAKFSDCFGSFPERVFYDGELFKQPFMTSHASYVWAINSLLVSRHGKQLSVCVNLPKKWADLSFENLTTPDGLRVSAKMKHGKISSLEIVNMNEESRDFVLVLPGQEERRLTLNSREKYTKLGGQSAATF